MKYLDTGSRDPSQTLAKWLEETLRDDVTELRLQTGFFALEGVGLLIPTLDRFKANKLTTNILIGSNDSGTLRDDVAGLVDILGIPRANAQLGIVNFGGAYFHPKTFHINRADGSQAAFVGSANLTASGLALHIEAGITLDTNDGDDKNILAEIAASIDRWFVEKRNGLTLVSGKATIDALTRSGILALASVPRTGRTGGSGGTPRPRLKSLVKLPRVGAVPRRTVKSAISAPAATSKKSSAPKKGFPTYLQFDPKATRQTANTSALTGASLPGGSIGLIIQLNRDSGRHFFGRSGTANISIPVECLLTIRFGIYGIHGRPRAEFDLKIRYLTAGKVIGARAAKTNVMGYGFTASETGHGDVRLLVPAAAKDLGQDVKSAGLALPAVGDVALLEWPTLVDHSFRLSFLDKHSPVSLQATPLYDSALTSAQVVGNGACWLPAGVSPVW